MQGESEREVVRVSVECCLQERSWNPYYVHLLQRLLASSKAHRVTLQYCLWDQFKLVEQTDMRRLINLAHLTGQLIASFTLPSSILKVRALLPAASCSSSSQQQPCCCWYLLCIFGVCSDLPTAAKAGGVAIAVASMTAVLLQSRCKNMPNALHQQHKVETVSLIVVALAGGGVQYYHGSPQHTALAHHGQAFAVSVQGQ